MTELGRYAIANARARSMLPSLLGQGAMTAWYALPDAGAMLDALSRTAHGGARGARKNAEKAIGDRIAVIGDRLVRTLPEREATFVRCFLLRHEVDNLKVVIRAVHRRRTWPEIAGDVVELGALATLALEPLAAARDLRELVERLRPTPYGSSLAGALHRVDTAGPFALEVALELDFYARLWTAIRRLDPADARRARDLLGILFDILNLGWIARYRLVLALAPEETLNYVLTEGRWLDRGIRRSLAESSEQTFATALEGTPYAALIAESDASHFDRSWVGLWRFLARQAERNLAAYPFHIGVVLGVLLLAEIEARDLRVLLVAKRLGMSLADALNHVATVRG
jgi:V/A-type H+-transporting ATPase subunit C